MSNYNELYKSSLRAYCMQCENWRTETLLGRTYSGCACDMDASECSLNELAQKIRKSVGG